MKRDLKRHKLRTVRESQSDTKADVHRDRVAVVGHDECPRSNDCGLTTLTRRGIFRPQRGTQRCAERNAAKGFLFVSHFRAEKLPIKNQTFLRYEVTDRLELGIGYLWDKQVVRPLANYTLMTERTKRLSLTVGAMVDSLQGGRQGYFLSLGKNLTKALGTPGSLYIGGAKVSNENSLRFIGGANVHLTRRVNVSAQCDGKDLHFGVTLKIATINGQPGCFSLLAVGGDSLGVLGAMQFAVRR